MSRCWLLCCWLLGHLALAADEPHTRVQTRLSPAAPYLVGSTLRLEIDLLTSSWFTQAPQPPELQLPGALVTPPGGQADKLTLTLDGETYFGLRLTYLISPTAARDFSIPALNFSVQLGQASAARQLRSQALRFSASAPASVGVDDQPLPAGNLLVAQQVRFSQRIEPSAMPLRVGDSLTRQLLVEADGAQAMLIPPAEFARIDDLKRYPLPPEVKPLSDGRGAISGGQRRDSVSYVIEQPGSYRLPAMQLSWWDAGSATLRHAEVPAVEFTALANSSYRLPFDLEADLQRLGRGQRLHLSPLSLWLGAGVLLLGLAGYFGKPWLTRHWRRLQAWRAQRKAAWLASEAYAWRVLKRALKADPLPLQPLYRWLHLSLDHTNVQDLNEHLPTASAQWLQQLLATRYADLTPAPLPHLDLHRSLHALRRLRARQARAAKAEQALRPLNPGVVCHAEPGKCPRP